MREGLLGDHEDTARSHFITGNIYFKRNNFTNALEAHKKALSMRERLLGEHKDTAFSHLAVGYSYFLQIFLLGLKQRHIAVLYLLL